MSTDTINEYSSQENILDTKEINFDNIVMDQHPENPKHISINYCVDNVSSKLVFRTPLIKIISNKIPFSNSKSSDTTRLFLKIPLDDNNCQDLLEFCQKMDKKMDNWLIHKNNLDSSSKSLFSDCVQTPQTRQNNSNDNSDNDFSDNFENDISISLR